MLYVAGHLVRQLLRVLSRLQKSRETVEQGDGTRVGETLCTYGVSWWIVEAAKIWRSAP